MSGKKDHYHKVKNDYWKIFQILELFFFIIFQSSREQCRHNIHPGNLYERFIYECCLTTRGVAD